MPSGPAYCDARGCGARIAFVTVTKAKGGTARMVINAEPDPAGNVAVREMDGLRIGRIATKDRPVRDGEVMYMPHWATCPRPKQFRRRETPAERQRRRSEEIARPEPAPPEPASLFGTADLRDDWDQPSQEAMRSPRGGRQSSRPQARHRWPR